jgi:hypothetical protein
MMSPVPALNERIRNQEIEIAKLRNDIKLLKHLCPHGRQTYRCRICSPDSKHFCKLCHYISCTKKYKGYCVSCFVYTFPEDELSKMARLKYDEMKVKVYLADRIPGFLHNQRIWLGDCSAPYRRFLDFHMMVGNTLVVIEVDEHQHKSYSKEDETLRIHEILHNIGLDKKMVFIRYNPSSYKCKGEQVGTDVRLESLVQQANEVIEYLESGEEYTDIHHEIKMFYDEDCE